MGLIPLSNPLHSSANLQPLEKASEKLKLFKADLLDYNTLCLAIEGCVGVFHVACPVPSTSVPNPEVEVVEPAANGTLNVMKACDEAKVKRIVYVSSVASVAMNPNWPKGQPMDETCWSDKEYCKATNNWYCYAKTEAESQAFEYAKRSGLDVVSLCPTVVLGPITRSVVNASTLILLKLLKGVCSTIFGILFLLILFMATFWRAGIAEFMATFLFLYITVLTVMGFAKSDDKCTTVGVQGIAWAFGGMIFALVYCTAGISGGHINPAVTFGLFLARKLSLTRAIFYMVMQCLGAICGAGVMKGFEKSQYEIQKGGANMVNSDYSKGSGLGAEIVGTFMLVYTVFSATDAKRSARDSHVPILAPLPIGFAVFLVHLATIPITGTGINPARMDE